MTSEFLIWCCCLFGFASVTVSLVCESYDLSCHMTKATSNTSSACPTVEQCDQAPGVTSACYALFGHNSQGRLQVIMKGCMVQNKHKCSRSSVCRGKQQILTGKQRLYYCCCSKDMCNNNVIIFAKETKRRIRNSTEQDAPQSVLADSSYLLTEVREPIRRLSVLIWAHMLSMTSCIIIMGLVILFMTWRKAVVKEPVHDQTQAPCMDQDCLSEVICNDKALSLLDRTFHWKRQDFQLITCLVHSKFGEVWQARLRGSNQAVRIRLSADSDEVYVYDKNILVTTELRDKNYRKADVTRM